MTIRDFPEGKQISPLWDGMANILRADAEYDRLSRGTRYYMCADCRRRCRGTGYRRNDPKGERRNLPGEYCHECSRAHDPEGRYPTPSYTVYE